VPEFAKEKAASSSTVLGTVISAALPKNRKIRSHSELMRISSTIINGESSSEIEMSHRHEKARARGSNSSIVDGRQIDRSIGH
jgi:hypothetical protein